MPFEVKIGAAIRSEMENLLATIASVCGVNYTTWNLRVEFNGVGDEYGPPIVVLEAVGSAIHSELSQAYSARLMRMRE